MWKGDLVPSTVRAGALAAMKAGAAYLPIDLRHPWNRARETLRHRCADLVLTGDEQLAGILPSDLPTYAQLHRAFDSTDSNDERPQISVGPDDPAYICFTSGSSGQAKGVVIGHQGIEGLLFDPEFQPYLASDRVAQVTTLAFDAATLEVWGALCTGACLVDVPKVALSSGPRLEAFLHKRSISAIWLTTSYFNAVASRNPSAFAGLRVVMVGGEAVDPAVMSRVFREGQPPERLLNCYGPTEATTLTTWHPITAEDAASGVIPIGRALQGRTVSVRDEDLRPVEVGKAGELLIGGPAVAYGYWNAPDLTEASFVIDPHAPSNRLYRSGDFCQELPDGRIVYLGRQDEQVKIRGFRVELSGVAFKILAIDGVQEAVVLARSTPFGSKELLAFIRTANGLTAEQVSAQLSESIEDYLVPARVIRVEALPLTANGKVDRAALLNLCESGKTPDRGLSTPVTATESALVSIWKQLFRRDDISTQDGFFSLGGDSLQLMELVARVETELDANLGPQHVKNPLRLACLAETIDQVRTETKIDRPVRTFLICSPWTMRGFPDAYVKALAGGGESRHLQVPPSLFDSLDTDLMQSMVSALQSQVLSMTPNGPYRIAGYSFSGLLAFELARRLEEDGHTVELLVLIDTVFGRRSLMGFLRAIRRRLSRGVSKTSRRARERKAAAEIASESPILSRCIREARQYRPRKYSGQVMLARSEETVSGGFASWKSQLQGRVMERRIDGNHLSLILGPAQINEVAQAIRQALSETAPR